MSEKHWTFFTNHSHVLFLIHFHPNMPMKDIADRVNITERAIHSIIRDLEHDGVITVAKEGRQNRYTINQNRPLRHAIESHKNVSDLLAFIGRPLENETQVS